MKRHQEWGGMMDTSVNKTRRDNMPQDYNKLVKDLETQRLMMHNLQLAHAKLREKLEKTRREVREKDRIIMRLKDNQGFPWK